MSKKIGQNKEAKRRIEKRVERTKDAKEGEFKNSLKTSAILKARSRPLSAASNMVLREEKQSRTQEPGFSGYFKAKYKDSPEFSKLPTDEAAAKKFATTNLKAMPKPTEYWQSIQ